jgi:Mg2+ and Co2+ transporter CorA
MVMFDVPRETGERIPSLLLDGLEDRELADPFWLYVKLLEELVRLQDISIWKIRNQLREMELARTPSGKPQPDYPRLHDFARHVIHVLETLDISVEAATSIVKQHRNLTSNMTEATKATQAAYRSIHNRLVFYEGMLSGFRHRASSNKERLKNEMQLAFSMVAEFDSGIAVEIGRAAQTDSATMRSITFVTLTFLPATFVSAVFSMSFFNFNPDTGTWTVSDKFWVYWVVAIPLTLVSLIVWYFWRKIFPPKLIGLEREISQLSE